MFNEIKSLIYSYQMSAYKRGFLTLVSFWQLNKISINSGYLKFIRNCTQYGNLDKMKSLTPGSNQ